MNENEVYCYFCNKHIKKTKIMTHIKFKHNYTLTDRYTNLMHQYYDEFIKTEGEGLCIVCGKPAVFFTCVQGYRDHCSINCSVITVAKNRTQEEKDRTYKIIAEKTANAQRGRTKEKYQYLRDHSERMKRDNSCHKLTEEQKIRAREKQSITVKEKIRKGEFTPCVTNSWANSRCRIKIENCDKAYRSSWEAVFQILNKSCEYEKLRIKYFSTEKNKDRIYIVDFIDNRDKIVYEIKPDSEKENITYKDKIKALDEWCNDNGYTYKIISDSYFKENAKKIDYDKYEPKIKKGMKQFLKE